VPGVFEWIFYFASLAKALELGTLGTVYTISRGGSVVLVWPLSVVLFGRGVTTAAAIGSLVVLGGLGLCGTGDSTARVGPTRRPRDRVAIACAIDREYHLAYKGAEDAGGNPSAVFLSPLASRRRSTSCDSGATVAPSSYHLAHRAPRASR